MSAKFQHSVPNFVETQLETVGIIAVEFRKEEDKEEAVRGSDLHLRCNPAHISLCRPGAAGHGDTEARVEPRRCAGCQPHTIKHFTQHCFQRRGSSCCDPLLPYSTTLSSPQKAFYLWHTKKTERRWHSSALLFCVKSEEATGDPSAKTKQRHKLLLAGNRCLRESWHSTTILLLTEINKRHAEIVTKWKEDP